MSTDYVPTIHELSDRCDRLLEALSECVTQDGAHCLAYGTDTPKLRARIQEINRIAARAMARIDYPDDSGVEIYDEGPSAQVPRS